MTDIDNETLWKTYSPKPNPWFSNEIVYEGWGKASFENPVGIIEGKTKIHVGETGTLETIMEPENLNTDIHVSGNGNFRISKFLSGNLGRENQIIHSPGHENVCSNLTVQTSEGVFVSEGKIYHLENLFSDNKVRFWFSKGTFNSGEEGIRKYWVVPLLNFISMFHWNNHPLLLQHPLRLFSTPTVPETMEEEQKQVALWAANSRNSLIAFEFGDKFGFIEPMPNYSEIEQALKI